MQMIGESFIKHAYRTVTGRCATLTVAANDSSALSKAQADYVCDGTDDQVEIQAAITAAAIGDKILLLAGRYDISSTINITKALTIEGEGHAWETGGTMIFLDDNSNCDIFLLSAPATHVFFLTIKNLFIDGNKLNQTSGNGIHIATDGDCSDSMFMNLGVQNMKENGIYIQYGWLHTLMNIWTEFNVGNGVKIDNSAQSKIVNVHSSWNGGRGLYCNGAADVEAIGGAFTQNQKEGILIDNSSKRIMISSATLSMNSKIGQYVYNALQIENTTMISVMNCIFDNDWKCEYSIEVDALTTDYSFVGNICNDDWPGGIHIIGGVKVGEIDNNIANSKYKNSNTATLVNGQTSIVVTHGLAITPSAGDIMVTPIEAWGNMTQFYIDTYTSTQFTIHSDQNPGQDVDFAWKASVL